MHMPLTTAIPRPVRGPVATGLTTLGLLVGTALLGASPAYAAAPTPGQQQPPGTQGLTTMLGWGGWLVSFVCVAGAVGGRGDDGVEAPPG